MEKVYSFKTTTTQEIDFERISRENHTVPIIIVKVDDRVIILINYELNKRFQSRMHEHHETSNITWLPVSHYLNYRGNFLGWNSLVIDEKGFSHPQRATQIMTWHYAFITTKSQFELHKYLFYNWFNALLLPPKNRLETEVYHYQ